MLLIATAAVFDTNQVIDDPPPPIADKFAQPLASILGDFTEEVSAHTNQTLGGLIQATLGNAVEIVVSIQALYANQIRVVQVRCPGSPGCVGGCLFCPLLPEATIRCLASAGKHETPPNGA